jgi:integrase
MLMSWDPAQLRWCKTYKSQRYTVACSVLGAPATKEGSYQKANEWWVAKRAEVDSAGTPAPRVLTGADALALVALRVDPSQWDAFAKGWEPGKLAEHLDKLLAVRDLLIREPLTPEATAVVSKAPEPEAAADRTVRAFAERFLTSQKVRADNGVLSPARAAVNRTLLTQHFVPYLGPDSPVSAVDAATLSGFHTHLLGRLKTPARPDGMSTAYALDVFGVARSFIRFCWEHGGCELPRNVDRQFSFGSPVRAVRTWTADEYKKAVDQAKNKLKLCLLLAGNCGMTQVDVSDLRDDEVDWESGTVTRQRSKTKGQANVPTVTYKLWGVTFELLKKYRSGTGRVLLNANGRPFCTSRLREDGKVVRTDAFALAFKKLKARAGLPLSLKAARKLGASMLERHETYGRYAGHFLGHSPRTVADRHYVVPSQEQFAAALAWLGAQLGQA